MNLVNFDPLTPAPRFNRLFDSFFNVNEMVGSDFAVNMPSVNVIENENGFNLEIAAPGVAKEDFAIATEKGKLTISTEKETKNESEVEGKYTRREFNYSAFSRTFHLPESIDREGIVASYANGVLTITLPKKEEIVREEKGRAIEIL